MSDVSKAVLITGCSTGIGRATAEHLAATGWKVYATARRPESIADLEGKVHATLPLDVTDEASMQAAVKQVEDAEGAVGVLVNNAGYSRSGERGEDRGAAGAPKRSPVPVVHRGNPAMRRRAARGAGPCSVGP